MIDSLKCINESTYYSKSTEETFDPLWNLFEKLEYLIKEEKALMVFLKVKKLLLHLQYNLIDICYVATNKHQQKYDIEEQVKFDIHDPIFNIKR